MKGKALLAALLAGSVAVFCLRSGPEAPLPGPAYTCGGAFGFGFESAILRGPGEALLALGCPNHADFAAIHVHSTKDHGQRYLVGQTGSSPDLGRFLSAIPDIDRDGWEDLAVGLPDYLDPQAAGEVLLLSGRSGAELLRKRGAGPGAHLGPAACSGSGPGIIKQLQPQAGARGFGLALCAIPDQDHDGSKDVAINAPDGACAIFLVLSGDAGSEVKLLIARPHELSYGVSLAAAGSATLAIGTPGHQGREAMMDQGTVQFVDLATGDVVREVRGPRPGYGLGASVLQIAAPTLAVAGRDGVHELTEAAQR